MESKIFASSFFAVFLAILRVANHLGSTVDLCSMRIGDNTFRFTIVFRISSDRKPQETMLRTLAPIMMIFCANLRINT